jgi:hypothetical protein
MSFNKNKRRIFIVSLLEPKIYRENPGMDM